MTGLADPDADAGDSAESRTSGRTRLGSYLVTVFVLVTVTFALPRALPGDPLSALVDAGSPTAVQDDGLRAELADYYGLDRSYVEQYGSYLSGLARGDLGISIRHNRPVLGLVVDRLPWTLLLIAAGILIAVFVGLVAGAHSGWRRGRFVDGGFLVGALTFNSFPAFFLASLSVFVFGATLGWFPLGGARTQFADFAPLAAAVDIAHHLVLPAVVVAIGFAASEYLVMRASMVSEAGADYLLMGRAKGLRDRRLKYRYAARNAVLPVVSLIGIHVGFALTNSIYVETVFAYPGLGRLMFEAVAFRDYPTLQACFLALGLVVVSANFLADSVPSRLDPRIST